MRLTKKQKEKIIKLFKKNKTITEISKKIGCSRPTIRSCIKDNGLCLRGQKTVINDELTKKICEGYIFQKKSGRVLASENGVSLHVVQKVLKKNNIEPRKVRYEYDETKFKAIRSQEDAYWLGFLYADGGVKLRKNTKLNKGSMYLLKLRLAIKDISHMKKFQTFMKTNSPVKVCNYKQKSYCEIEINNKTIVQNIMNMGCIPNKSLKIRLPKNINPNLLRHFIRGYIDGDGWHTIDKKENRFIIGFLSNEKFIKDVSKFLLLKNIPIGTICCRGNIYQIQYRKHQDKLWNFLYWRASLFLERKKQVYLRFLKNDY